VNRNGVVYDTGTVFSGPGWKVNTRPRLDPRIAGRELEIIRDDLHCNAVRLRGQDIGRLTAVAEQALRAGLQVWLSPELFERDATQVVRYAARAAAAAEPLRRQWPGRLVFGVGSEAMLFVRGIVPGKTIRERLGNLFRVGHADEYAAELNAFLGQAAAAVRNAFGGEISYAALPFEGVDWSLFDVVGVDLYREARVKDRYTGMLHAMMDHGKPVVVTEFGMRTYADADTSGALGFGVVDNKSMYLHTLPLIGRFVRPRLQAGDWRRDEDLQAREVGETLAILEAEGADGAFVCEFVTATAPYSDKAAYDLDMSAMSLVKSYERGHGTTYQDMPWEPKQAFGTVADFYKNHPPGQ